MKTGISKMWSKVADAWLGIKSGRHCHWCKSMVSNDGDVNCGNKKSKFADGGRIRTWDGIFCAEKCLFFELDDFYKDDANYHKIFSKGEQK